MEAKRQMVAGMEFLNSGDFHAALPCFDRATKLRQALPWRDDPQAAWEMAAAHLNRGDALRGTDDPGAAIAAYDLAIQAMEHVPLPRHPHCAGRLVLATINRATVLGELGRVEEAAEGFAGAEKLLRFWDEIREPEVLLSMLHANRARMWLACGRAIPGWEDARAAVAVIPSEDFSDASIRARAILCHALALLLDEPGGVQLPGDWIGEATDAAEEALSLVRSTGRGEPWMADLVRYGAKIYRVCQPQFLGEFVAEWMGDGGPLGGDRDLVRDIRAELLLARVEVERRVMRHPHDTAAVFRETAILAAIQTAEARIPASPNVTSPSQTSL